MRLMPTAAQRALARLHRRAEALQATYGDPALRSIFGGGCTVRPRAMLVFMNPTARNVSTSPAWKGIRVPWLGTKTVWQLFADLAFISRALHADIQHARAEEWTPAFAARAYEELASKRVYVTNLAKCTQVDARPLHDNVFREYLSLLHEEISLTQPERIVTFGNQVSSIVLGRSISVSEYANGPRAESLSVEDATYPVHPVYYPVGQGRRNMPIARRQLEEILATP